MNIEEILKEFKGEGIAELTNRLIPEDPNFENPEWEEHGTLDNVPVKIYYRTTPEDQEIVDNNGGDWGAIDWQDRITKITLDLYHCDRQETPESEKRKVCNKYKIDWD